MNRKSDAKKIRPKKSQQKPVAAPSAKDSKSILQELDLNAVSARKAIILSEIIGPPAAKRQRRK